MLAGKALGITDALMVSGVGIVVVMAELALLAVLVFLLSRLVSTLVGKKNADADSAEVSDVITDSSAAAQASDSSCVELYGVDEQTAATIMATVSHQTGVDLKHLDFKSIKLLDTPLELIGVDDPTAAMVMAVVSHQTGIPLEKLDFRRIRALEWNGIDEPTVAIIMALVSHQTGIPLERLEFKSIKPIEE
jgi:Na+-transporting methylmalonyl-CoA/oxaloacetate decarboxylase gamma subunit